MSLPGLHKDKGTCPCHPCRRLLAKLPWITLAVGVVLGLLGVIAPPLALALGAIIGLASPTPLPAVVHRTAKWMLQGSIVLLGFGLNLAAVLHAGASGFGLAAASIGVTFFLGHWLTKWLGVRPSTGRLISAGTAICGGSAIAAVGSATDADEGDMTVAMGTVFILNAAALYLFPAVGHAVGLSQHQFGVWAGVAIQDISSTVGAAARYGPEALATATAVKLSRALWIVPVVLAFVTTAKLRRRWTVGNGDFGFTTTTPPAGRVQIPWFIGLFVIACVLRTLVPAVAAAGPTIGHVATTGLTVTLLLIGTGLNRRLLAGVGWRAMTLGVVLWLVLSIGGLAAVLRMA